MKISTNSKKKTSDKALKACFIYYQRFGALLYREATALRRKGYNVDIICLRQTREEKIVHNFNGINLYQIQSRAFREKNPAFYFLRLALFFLKAMVLMAFLGPFRKYELVHITSPPDIMVFAAIVPKMLGAKIILDIHDIGPEFFMRKLHIQEDRMIINIMKLQEKICSGFADYVITVTDLWRKRLVSRSVCSEKCSVVLNVPDEEVFKPLKLNHLKKPGHFNLYYHGSLEEHFGIDTLLQAMPLIKKEIPHVMLHIYGKGRLYDYLEKMAIRLEVDSCIKFHGTVPFYVLPEVLKDADIGMVPTKGSIFSDEALSMKSLEYMSLGIPIVISKTKAHSFYFDSSMVKFFKPEDSYDLAMQVVSLYMHPLERETLIHNSLTFVTKYGWGKTKKTYTDIVDHLINGYEHV